MVKLYRPGTRRGNTTWVARGHIDGRQYEIRTAAKDKPAARRAWDAFATAERAERSRGLAGEARGFAEVTALYIAARRPSRDTRRYLDKLCAVLGPLDVAEVRPLEIAEAAARLYPTARNETRNRQAYAPAAAVLHFAAESGLRDYLVV